MKKRICAAAFAASMVMTVLTGCGGNGNQQAPDTQTPGTVDTQASGTVDTQGRVDDSQQDEQQDTAMNTAELEVAGGKIVGTVDANGVASYKGIPYAASTEGENRFRAPQPVESWEGTLDCTQYGDIAMQNEASTYGGGSPWTAEYLDLGKTYASGEMSEDCLNLNVWTMAKEGDKLPVIVYIHGGGNNSGSGACEIYTGDEIAQNPIVYVSINYRVGIFGFLAYEDSTGESVNGNFGIMDQIAALKWVQENITKFGGDPTNVTIVGQSAGSRNCQTLIASPAAEGLFNKAVCMSANMYASSPFMGTSEEEKANAAQMLGGKTLEELRAMSSEEVQALAAQYNPSATVIDGEIVTQSLAAAYASGNYNNVDMLWGTVTEDCALFSKLTLPDDDGNPFTPVMSVTPENLKIAIQEALGDQADACMALYPIDESAEDVIDVAKQINFDSMISGYFTAAVAKNTGDSAHKTYIYNFSRVVPDTPERMAANGAFHTGDVGYWLNHFTTTYERPWEQTDYDLGKLMSSYIVNFVTTGNPNGNGLFDWKDVASTDTISYLGLGDTIEWIEMDADKNAFWSNVQ